MRPVHEGQEQRDMGREERDKGGKGQRRTETATRESVTVVRWESSRCFSAWRSAVIFLT